MLRGIARVHLHLRQVCSSVPSENCTWDERSLKQSFTLRLTQHTDWKPTLCMKRSAKPFGHRLRLALILCKKIKKKTLLPGCLSEILALEHFQHHGWFAETDGVNYIFLLFFSDWCENYTNVKPLRVTQPPPSLYGANRWEFNSWKLWLMALRAYFLHLISDCIQTSAGKEKSQQ